MRYIKIFSHPYLLTLVSLLVITVI